MRASSFPSVDYEDVKGEVWNKFKILRMFITFKGLEEFLGHLKTDLIETLSWLKGYWSFEEARHEENNLERIKKIDPRTESFNPPYFTSLTSSIVSGQKIALGRATRSFFSHRSLDSSKKSYNFVFS